MKKPFDLQSIRLLQKEGHLKEAKKGYLSLLRHNSKDSEALHGLGILFAQEENYSEATDYLKKAHELQPNNLLISLHLANILKFQELFHEAIDILENVLKHDPHASSALNNLGTIYYSLEKFNEAIAFYRKAIENQPDYIDAYYNLGLALTKQKELSLAIQIYQELLKRSPKHFAARFQLASLLARKEKFKEAIENFLQIEETYPHHFETETNLATCYLKLGALNEAKKHYFKALELTPKDFQVLFNMGVINMQQGLVDIAIQYYQRAASVNPNDFAVHNNLGVAFLAKAHVGLALEHFQEALRIKPENVSIDHTVKVLSSNRYLLTSPPDYIKSLFDSYADHYEPHLLTGLDYKVPELLFTAVSQVFSLKERAYHILDLGCGTGLCGSVFKFFAKKLIGVDLSENMLNVAKNKNNYDELITENIETFLENKIVCYDLILAGDVFVYIGDLNTLFKKIHDALVSQGIFAFNAEIEESHSFRMNQSGRFSHQYAYLEQLAKKYNFTIAYYEKKITRMQNNAPVYGHIFVLFKI